MGRLFLPEVMSEALMVASERLTGALPGRFTHHVHILEMNGDSYRLKQSKGRRRKTAKAEEPAASEAADPVAGEILKPEP